MKTAGAHAFSIAIQGGGDGLGGGVGAGVARSLSLQNLDEDFSVCSLPKFLILQWQESILIRAGPERTTQAALVASEKECKRMNMLNMRKIMKRHTKNKIKIDEKYQKSWHML